MGYVIAAVIVGIIIWSYYSTIKDIFSFFQRRKFKSQMKVVGQDTTSTAVKDILRAANEKQPDNFIRLVDNANEDTLKELIEKNRALPYYEDYAKACPDSARARYVYGNYLVGKAWEARSGAYANKLSQEQVDGFYKYLALAKTELIKANELDNTLLGVYDSLIKVAKGQSDKSGAFKRYEDACQQSPNNYVIHSSMQLLLTEKWLGSSKEMFEFARSSAGRVAKGPLKGLIVDAHFEAMRQLDGVDRKNYFDQPDVQREIKKAYTELGDISPSANYAEKSGYYSALNSFVVAFHMMKDLKSAADAHLKIGPHYQYYPWWLITDPSIETYKAYRLTALMAK